MIKIVLKFGLVGVINTIIDYVLFQLFVFLFALHAPLSLFIASMISGGVAVINSFILNKKWTFEDKSTNHVQQFVRFVIINLLSLALNSGTVALLGHIIGDKISLGEISIRSVFITKGFAIVLTMIINFFAYRLFVFKKVGEEYTI